MNRAKISGTSGVTLSNSRLRGVPDANVFTFVSDGSGYRLQNKGNNYYVYSSNNRNLTANSTNYTVFTVYYYYYYSNFYIYYSVYDYNYNYYNYYMQYRNSAFSVSTYESYLYLWQKHETLYYTTAPSVASGSILEPVQTVEPGQTEEPAVLDLVSFTNPVREGEEQTEYNIFLRAVYGPYNPDATTHIYWYANNGTDAHNGAGERYTSEYTFTENGVTTTTNRLPINAQVDIPVPTANAASQTVFVGDSDGALTWEDHIFLGWARVDNGGSADYSEAQILTADDLYLKWDGSKYLVKNDSGEFVEFNSQKVYADETTPYHDMYAVWSGYYYVFHSSTGKIEAIEVSKSKTTNEETQAVTVTTNTANLVDMVPEHYLYGGYYTYYGGAKDILSKDDYVDQNGSMVVNTGSMRDYKNQALQNRSASDRMVQTSAATYDGSAAKNGDTRFWEKKNACGKFDVKVNGETIQHNEAPGNAITPAVGQVYYLKEVPETYLTTKYLYTYETMEGENEGVIQNFFMLTVMDDAFYKEIGFRTVEGADSVEAAAHAGITPRTAIAGKFEVIQRGNGISTSPRCNDTVVTVDPSNFGLTRGYIAVTQADDLITQEAGKSFTVMPAWETLDGVEVNSHGTLKLSVSPDKKTIDYKLLGSVSTPTAP